MMSGHDICPVVYGDIGYTTLYVCQLSFGVLVLRYMMNTAFGCLSISGSEAMIPMI
jgi:hypothetical protein